MIKLLARIFIKDRENLSDPGVRSAYGILCSFAGVGLNILLFVFKYLAGSLSGSIAITADAFNNLSDAGSSVITFIGFRMALKKPDRSHPYGHGRAEYIAGLAVAAVILVMGFELGKSSVEKIISPTEPEAGLLPMIILAVAILVKLYMFAYNRSVGSRIGSPAIKATAADSISDAISTSVVLVCMLLSRFTSWPLDGWAGAFVSLFILWTGYRAAMDTIKPLLGQAPEPEFVRSIYELALAYPEIVGVHDLMVHDYGPGRVIISLHAEVPDNGDINVLHDAIDSLESELEAKLGCLAVIHMDPISTNDENVSAIRLRLVELVREIDPKLMLHDFRMVEGPTHTNLVFDLVVPQPFRLSDEQTRLEAERLIREQWPNFFAVIKIDKDYT